MKGCEYLDEIELWDVEKVEMAAYVVGRVRDCVLESPWVFVRLVERRALVSIKVAQKWIESKRVESGITRQIDIANFGVT